MSPAKFFTSLPGVREIRLMSREAYQSKHGYRKRIRSHYPTNEVETQQVLKFAEDGEWNIYYSLNSVATIPTAISPAGQTYQRAIKDEHVTRRSAILLDIDTVKAGESATDCELELARPVYENVLKWCNDQGHDILYKMVSGNGRGIVLDTNLPANRATDQHVSGLLQHLASLFNSEHAHIDTSVFNAGQVTRLPGTINYKPDSSTISYII